MRQFLKTPVLSFLLAIILLCSCSSEDGTDGTDGTDGNIDIISIVSRNKQIAEGYDNIFKIPELTQSILDNGLVYCYAKQSEGNSWSPLPASIDGEVMVEIFAIEVGQITIWSDIDILYDVDFRFVLVEDNLSSSLANKDIKNMSYKEAMNYFDLDY